jgi:enoyl-CoA hydratase/carnithine racemase
MESMLSVERTDGIVVATLSRPPVNALNDELIARLEAALDQAVADEEVRVLHICSSQRVFCAGADLALMRSCFATQEGLDAMLDLVRRMQRLFERIESAPFVTLAEINGAALGGGMELALACDLRVAASEAKLGLPEARLGLLPGGGGTQRLTRLCGEGIAKRLILGAEIVSGADALGLGMVQWAEPRATLKDFARALTTRFAAIPRAALAANKRCIALAMRPDKEGYAEELSGTRYLYGQPETRRRVTEFLDKGSAS